MYICAYMKRQKTSQIPLKAIIASFEAFARSKQKVFMLYAVTSHGLICDKIWHASWETQKVGPKTPGNIFKSVFLKIHPMFGPGTIMYTNMFGKWF